jgi:GTPase SAR1 family protein
MENLAKLQPRTFGTHNTINWANVYDGNTDCFDETLLFVAYFNVIPNWITVPKIDCRKANEWFLGVTRADIADFHYVKRYIKDSAKTAEYDDLFYLLYDDLLVYFNTCRNSVRFLYRTTGVAKVDRLIEGIKHFPKKEKPNRKIPEIKLLVNSSGGMNTYTMKITKPKLAIEDNYNDDLLPVHQTILARLKHKSDKGLVLLHGKPGTGKTSYIRYLITQTRKNIIFLPPNMAAAITDPGLMGVLVQYPDSIFVIEDAENIIIDRNRQGNSSVSALLNLSDGLLSDCLNIQIICSFNTDLTNVDTALLRKGRLIAKYEFRELEIRKAQALSNRLGFNSVITSPMTLTAIYNQDESEFQPVRQRNVIGFNTTLEKRIC